MMSECLFSDCPREETTSTGGEATATTTGKGVSLWLPAISLFLAGCVYYIIATLCV